MTGPQSLYVTEMMFLFLLKPPLHSYTLERISSLKFPSSLKDATLRVYQWLLNFAATKPSPTWYLLTCNDLLQP